MIKINQIVFCGSTFNFGYFGEVVNVGNAGISDSSGRRGDDKVFDQDEAYFNQIVLW